MRDPIPSRMRRPAVPAVAFCAIFVTAACAGGQPSHLSGLYLQNQGMGRGDVWHYYYFWPDGHVCETMPTGGLDPAPTFAAVSAQSPKDCGTYTLGGGQLRLQTGGAAQPTALKIGNFDASGFALSDFPTIRVPAFRDGATLSGSWNTTIIKGDDYRDETFTFRPDGTFTFDEKPVRTFGAPPRHIEGTYRLSGNTLRTAMSGTSQVLSIHPFPNDPRISVDGHVFRKVQ